MRKGKRRDGPDILTGFGSLLAERPGLKYLFFGGKGGVGKTTVSSATSLHLAQRKKRTLLTSTDYAHGLSYMLGQSIGSRIRPVRDFAFLHGYEINPEAIIERESRKAQERIISLFGQSSYSDIKDYLDSMKYSPAIAESAMFDEIVELMRMREYDHFVFDTAPIGQTAYLLKMGGLFNKWVDAMIGIRKNMQEAGHALNSMGAGVPEDNRLDMELRALMDKFEGAKKLLTNHETTAFVFVLTPEELPILITQRGIDMLNQFGVPVAGVVVNGILDPALCGGSGYMRAIMEGQQRCLKEISSRFGGMILAEVPKFEATTGGVPSLLRVRQALFGGA